MMQLRATGIGRCVEDLPGMIDLQFAPNGVWMLSPLDRLYLLDPDNNEEAYELRLDN